MEPDYQKGARTLSPRFTMMIIISMNSASFVQRTVWFIMASTDVCWVRWRVVTAVLQEEMAMAAASRRMSVAPVNRAASNIRNMSGRHGSMFYGRATFVEGSLGVGVVLCTFGTAWQCYMSRRLITHWRFTLRLYEGDYSDSSLASNWGILRR